MAQRHGSSRPLKVVELGEQDTKNRFAESACSLRVAIIRQHAAEQDLLRQGAQVISHQLGVDIQLTFAE